MIIRKVGLRALANFVGSVYVMLGLIAGAIISIVAVSGIDPGESLDAMEKAVFSPFAIFWLPIVFGIKGYIVGALAGWVYNRAAASWGGIEIEIAPGRNPAACDSRVATLRKRSRPSSPPYIAAIAASGS